MESVLQKTDIELEALKPPAQKFSAFSSYSPRRSHLESASYRSLARILSYCLDHSLVPSSQPPERNLFVKNPTSGQEQGILQSKKFGPFLESQERGIHLEEDAGENINEETPMERAKEGDRCADDREHDGSSVADALLALDLDNFDDEFEARVDSELLSNVMSDCGKLIGAHNGEDCLGGKSHEGNGQAVHQETVHKDLEITKGCFDGSLEGISNLVGVPKVAIGDVNSELLIKAIPDVSGLIDKELCFNAQSYDGNENVGHVQIAVSDLEIPKACVHYTEDGVSNLKEVSEVVMEDVNSKLLKGVMPDCSISIEEPRRKHHVSEESQEGREQADNDEIVEKGLEITKVCVRDADKGIAVASVGKGDANSKLLSTVTPDCGRLIDASNLELHCKSELHDGNGECSDEDIENNDLEIAKVCIHGEKEGLSYIAEVSEVTKGDELEKLLSDVFEEKVCISLEKLKDRRNKEEDVSNLVNNKQIEVTNDEMPILLETQDGNSIFEDHLRMRNLEEDQASTFALQIDRGEFEEGEIPDEIQDLEDSVDIDDKGAPGFDSNELASVTTSIHKQDDFELGTGYKPSIVERRGNSFDCEADLSDTSDMDSTDEASTQEKQMVMMAREKKRNPLTEERKAKKKNAKKRKRAQKNREQGVKKLKLHVITKPKEVKICNFYLMGKCQLGDRCKYSHDAPLMKSAPCKYFACNSCLKGDDCPYDHELSKYPCHKFVSTGSCIRGDGCKFSHKIPATDEASLLTSGKLDSHSTSEQPKLKNQPVGAPAMKHKRTNDANQVPKGVRFLSFGAKTDLTGNHKESLPVRKFGQNEACNRQRQEESSAHSRQPNASLVASSGWTGNASSLGIDVKDSGNIGNGGSSITPPATGNHELSEATKILEEFLFCSTD